MTSIFSTFNFRQEAKYFYWAIAYAVVYQELWFLCTQFETITHTTSWYLPAALRLFAHLVSPYRAWIYMFVFQRSNFIVFAIYPSWISEQINGVFLLSYWLSIHLIIIPAIFLFIAWWLKRKLTTPYFNNLQASLVLMLFSIINSLLIGTTVLSRRIFADILPVEAFPATLFAFLIGDFVGIVVLMPLLLIVHQVVTKQLALDRTIGIPIMVWSALMVVLGLITASDFNLEHEIKYLAIIPAILFSYLYRWQGAGISSFFVGLLAFVSALQSDAQPIEHQFYIVSVCLSCILIGAASSEIFVTQQALKASNASLVSSKEKLEVALTRSQNLSDKLITIQEAERKQLSRDLHDDFGHRIVELQLQVKNLVAEPAKYAQLMNNRLQDLYHALKNSIGRLRPLGIETLSIDKVLVNSEFMRAVKERGINFECHLHGEPILLCEQYQLNIYRIIQEAITNSIKHANASKIEVDFYYQQDSFMLCIQDNGKGFSPKAKSDGSLGVVSMHERASKMRGGLNICTNNMGTLVSLQIPINANALS